MKKLFIAILTMLALHACTDKPRYESVDGDPMGVRIYTLKNGLKVYTSVNRDQPRIQAYVAVRAGSKNDPLTSTGLAHYFEHMMFKGTPKFGTTNYEAERPLLDSIETLFNIYRQTTDTAQRRLIYSRIDSISYEASKLAIPGEYDKLMSAIGSEGSNAFTNYDCTCFVEDVPSNQLDNWLKITAERFQTPVLRGFHTELETVYEEYNMYASEDRLKVWNAMQACLFPNHPYGRDIIGLPEHLKNPSITDIKAFHQQWYVPNNMAIVLSGDFDPDEAVALIEKHLGGMTPNDLLPDLKLKADEHIATNDTTVYGLMAEYIQMGWRLPG
ncbi:MAG: insulinase family protein, partial [Bacteroidaceae bacterium]|nr:insulinase family protein [Bacteroidaceae bacterium]